MFRVTACVATTPTAVSGPAPPGSQGQPRPRPACSASQLPAPALSEAAWQTCLSGMDALEQQLDACVIKGGAARALRRQFASCKQVVRRANKALAALDNPAVMRSPDGYREPFVDQAHSPAQHALLMLDWAQSEVATLASDAAAAASRQAPQWLKTVGAVAAGVAVALGAVALAVFFPMALPLAAATLIAIGAGGGASVPLSVLAVQLFQLRRSRAAAALSRQGAETLATLHKIAATAEQHAACVREIQAVQSIQQRWRRHVGRMNALRQKAQDTGDNSKFLKTVYAAPGNERSYYHYRNPQDAAKEGMPTTFALWGAGQNGTQLGEGGYNRVQLGPMGLVIRQEKKPTALLHGAPMETYADLTSFVGAVKISPSVSVARFAGTPLDCLLLRGNKVPLSCFEHASRDLKSAHCRGLFHRDIKPSNLTLKKDRVRFIDCDSMIDTRRTGAPLKHFGTRKYASVDPTLCSDPKLALKTADEFAFLVSMIEATIRDTGEVTRWLENRVHQPGPVQPPIAVESWLNVHTTSPNALYRMLSDPGNCGLSTTVHLHDMISWRA